MQQRCPSVVLYVRSFVCLSPRPQAYRSIVASFTPKSFPTYQASGRRTPMVTSRNSITNAGGGSDNMSISSSSRPSCTKETSLRRAVKNNLSAVFHGLKTHIKLI